MMRIFQGSSAMVQAQISKYGRISGKDPKKSEEIDLHIRYLKLRHPTRAHSSPSPEFTVFQIPRYGKQVFEKSSIHAHVYSCLAKTPRGKD